MVRKEEGAVVSSGRDHVTCRARPREPADTETVVIRCMAVRQRPLPRQDTIPTLTGGTARAAAALAGLHQPACDDSPYQTGGDAPGFGAVTHTGRKTHGQHRTPLNVLVHADDFDIAFTCGPQGDWVRNVLAGGGCKLQVSGDPGQDTSVAIGVSSGSATGSARQGVSHAQCDPWWGISRLLSWLSLPKIISYAIARLDHSWLPAPSSPRSAAAAVDRAHAAGGHGQFVSRPASGPGTRWPSRP